MSNAYISVTALNFTYKELNNVANGKNGLQARIVLRDALGDAQLLENLTRFGYNSERIQEGLAHCEETQNALATFEQAIYNRGNALDLFQQALRAAQIQYGIDTRISRIALKESDASDNDTLSLNSKREKSYDGWQKRASIFYFGLRNQPEMQAVVHPMGLTTERIELGIQYLASLATLRTELDSLEAHVRETRKLRNEAFGALNQWMVTFRLVARAAFTSQPTYLVRLGLAPLSGKSVRKSVKSTVQASEGRSVLTPPNLLAVATS